MVVSWVMVFTGLRVAMMDFVLKPLAKAGGVLSKKGHIRFAEQAWLLCYDSTSFSIGFVSLRLQIYKMFEADISIVHRV
jgi:acyl-CoA-dependent ceramide synthase